jgi:hypothetical protein
MRFWVAICFPLLLLASIPLSHATPNPGIPVLLFSTEGGPYLQGQTAQTIGFSVQNEGDTINGLTLDVKGASGWTVLSGSVPIGTLQSGSQYRFSMLVSIGGPSYPSVIFTARSIDHVQMDFLTTVLVATGVTAQAIANSGENVSPLLSIASQWGTFVVNQIGSLLFPTTQNGITDSTGLQQILQGYFIRAYLANHSNLASLLGTLADQYAKVASDANIVQSNSNQGFSFSIGSSTFTNSLYQFLSMQFPLSQWTLGILPDTSVAAWISWAAQHFVGLNISADEIIQLANLMVQVNAGPLGGYSDLSGLAQLISGILSTGTPDLSSLNQALGSVTQTLNELGNAVSFFNSVVGIIQGMISWLQSFAHQLYQIFQHLVDWISSNIPLFANALNSFVIWLYNTINPVINGIIDIFNQGTQAQSSTQSAQSGLSPMANSVQQSSSDSWNSLSTRLSEVAGQAKQSFEGFCAKYQPAKGWVTGLTGWVIGPIIGTIATPFTIGALNPQDTTAGLLFAENAIDVGCRLSLDQAQDPVEIISMGTGATVVLGQIFPGEEGQFHAIANILNYLGPAVSGISQLVQTVGSSGYDVNGLTNVISNYQSAFNQGNLAYQSSNHDYIGALGALAPMTNLPNLQAVSTVLNDVQPCGTVASQFSSYTQEGMVAPDLQTQVQSCRNNGQSAISSIVGGDYGAVSVANSLPSFASQLSSAIDARHHDFLAAKDAISQLDSAASSIQGCGFLWVQPDPNQLHQAEQALQQAKSQFNSGQYSDSIQTVNSNINQATSTGQACSSASWQAKLEVGGVGVAVAAAALSGFGDMRKSRSPKKDKNNSGSTKDD